MPAELDTRGASRGDYPRGAPAGADNRPPAQTKLLAELRVYGIARQGVSPDRENVNDVAAALDAVLVGSRRATSRLRMFFSGSRKRGPTHSASSKS